MCSIKEWICKESFGWSSCWHLQESWGNMGHDSPTNSFLWRSFTCRVAGYSIVAIFSRLFKGHKSSNWMHSGTSLSHSPALILSMKQIPMNSPSLCLSSLRSLCLLWVDLLAVLVEPDSWGRVSVATALSRADTNMEMRRVITSIWNAELTGRSCRGLHRIHSIEV